MRLVTGNFVFLLLLIYQLAQHEILGQQASYFQQEGLLQIQQGQLEAAEKSLKQAYSLFVRQQDWPKAASSLFCIALDNLYMGELEKTDQLLQSASLFLKQHLPADSAFLAEYLYYRAHLSRMRGERTEPIGLFLSSALIRTHAGVTDSITEKAWLNLGYLVQNMGRYDLAEKYYFQSLQIATKNKGPYDASLSTLYLNIGALFSELGNFSRSQEMLEKAEFICKKHPEAEEDLKRVYLNLGSLFSRMGELDKSLLFNRQSLKILKESSLPDLSELAIIYNNMCAIFLSKAVNESLQSRTGTASALLDSASFYGLLGLSVQEEGSKPKLCTNLGQVYTRMDKPALAGSFFRRAITYQTKLTGKDHFELAIYYIRYGQFLCDSVHDLNGAQDNISRAITILEHSVGTKHWETGMAYSIMGDIYNARGAWGTALKYYQQAVLAISEKNSCQQIGFTPPYQNLVHSSEALNIVKKKGNCLFGLYQVNHQPATLRACLLTYETAAGLVNDLRQGFSSEESKIDLTASEGEISDRLIEVSWSLYQCEKNQAGIARLFSWMEKGKASVLLSSIRSNQALNMGGIPPEMVARENMLRRGISFYAEQLYEENKLQEPDQLKISGWQQNLFQMRLQYDSLVKQLEKKYPSYYSLKYSGTAIPLSQCRKKIGTDEVLIEYALTARGLYSVMISQDTVMVNYSMETRELEAQIDSLHRLLSVAVFPEESGRIYVSFSHCAYRLYTLLLGPYKDHIKKGKLLVIPDESLALIPFDVLVTDSIKETIRGFRDLPYLLRDVTTSYSYSATLLFGTRKRQSIWWNKLLAVAPGYHTPVGAVAPHENTRQSYLNNLFPIPGAKEEARLAAGFFKSTLLLDSMATESRFKSLAEKFDILHLSMHTIIDNQSPMYSKLVFSATQDSSNDGLLNTYEIYNLKLHCKLAVLTSCNTGMGQRSKGEGVMSLARAFVYAGCPGLLMSFWEVEDNSSLELMRFFYEGLKKGKDKDEALRQAKLRYLNQADPLFSHPYFWSGIVMIGDSQPVAPTIFEWAGVIALPILLILLPGIFMFRSIRKKKRPIRLL